MRVPAFDALAKSDEPSLRYKLRAHVLGENPESRAMLALRREIKRSPLYWHYDILGGLKALAEAGLVHDARCAETLAVLDSKRLPDGGFPAEQRYYVSPHGKNAPGNAARERVDWGGTSARKSNPWVTADALAVLAAAQA